MAEGSIASFMHLFLLLCLTLSCAPGAVTVRAGPACKTSSGTPGRCVALDICPKLKAIDEKPYVSSWELNLLIGAANACPPDSEQFCCAVSEIKSPTTTTTQAPTTRTRPPTIRTRPPTIRTRPSTTRTRPSTVDRDTDVHIPFKGTCLQQYLGMDERWIGRGTLDSSFGVFITYKERRNRCVGSLIMPDWVLTAAHCVSYPQGTLSLYVNALNVREIQELKVLEGDVEPMYVRETVIHEEYNSTTHDNDIALLRLQTIIAQDESTHVPKTICIPMEKQHDVVAAAGSALNCFGWGSNANGTANDLKQWMTLERISLAHCQAKMNSTRLSKGGSPRISERHICTVTITGNDAFAGFSGGPLMYRKDGTWYLIGLINYGVGATNSVFPVVSLNVQQYTDWILNHIKERQNKDIEAFLNYDDLGDN